MNADDVMDNIQDAFLSEEDYRSTVKHIMMLPIPSCDPATGDILYQWNNAESSVDGGRNEYRGSLDASP